MEKATLHSQIPRQVHNNEENLDLQTKQMQSGTAERERQRVSMEPQNSLWKNLY